MSAIQVVIKQAERYRQAYFVEPIVNQKCPKFGETLVLKWYDNVERQGKALQDIPLPEVGVKYKISLMGDGFAAKFDSYCIKHRVLNSERKCLCNAISNKVSGNEYDVHWFVYTFEASDQSISSVLKNDSPVYTDYIYLSRCILVVEQVG